MKTIGITPAEYAQSFIDVVEPGMGFIVGETVDIYDENDMRSGFCVELTRSGEESGYIVIKFDENGPVISEYVTEPGVENLYDEIAKNYARANEKSYAAKSAQLNAPKKIYSFAPNDYAIEQEKNGEKVFVEFGGVQELSASEFAAEKQAAKSFQGSKAYTSPQLLRNAEPHTGDVIFDRWEGTYGPNDTHTIPGFHSFEVYGIEEILSPNFSDIYACTVVAMLNYVSYIDYLGYADVFINDNPLTTYNTLWNLSYSFIDENGDGRTPWGGPAVLYDYFNDYTSHSCEVDQFSVLSFAAFTGYLDDDFPMIYEYAYGTGAHTVFVVGYVMTSVDDYLRVFDGWNTYARFLNYSGFSYGTTYTSALMID